MREHRCHHAGRGCLAMGSGNRDAVLHTHQLREHFCPRDDRDLATVGFLNFRILQIHSSRCNDDINLINILGAVAISDCPTQARQTAGNITLFKVGT